MTPRRVRVCRLSACVDNGVDGRICFAKTTSARVVGSLLLCCVCQSTSSLLVADVDDDDCCDRQNDGTRNFLCAENTGLTKHTTAPA